jgi:hypothetical protein
MGIAGYVSACVQLYCVGFYCFTTCFGLHGHLQVCSILYIHMLEGFCFADFFLCLFSRGHTLHVSICVLFLCCFPSLFLLFPCVCACLLALSLLFVDIWQTASDIWKKNIPHTWGWPYRPKHVVKDSENQHNKAARRRKHKLQNPLNNTVQQDTKI